jgi:tape measure domain-containing protein
MNIGELIATIGVDTAQIHKAGSEFIKLGQTIQATVNTSNSTLKRQSGIIEEIDDRLSRLREAKKKAFTYEDIVKYNKKIAETKYYLKEYEQAGLHASNTINKNMLSTNKLMSGVTQSIIRLGATYLSLQAGVRLIKNIFSTTKELDQLHLSYKTIIKDQDDLSNSQLFVSNITKQYGLDLIKTSNSYLKFAASAKISGLSIASTNEIFKSFAKTGSVMGKSTADLSSIFLALEQMLNKGRVSSEELRRQLGEKVPAAVAILAQSMGITTKKLDEMMRVGLVLSKDVLPNFAVTMEKTLGISAVTRIDTLVAAQNRLKTSWVNWVDSIKASESFINILNNLSKLITPVHLNTDNIIEANRYFEETKESIIEIGKVDLVKGVELYKRSWQSTRGILEEYSKKLKDTQTKGMKMYSTRFFRQNEYKETLELYNIYKSIVDIYTDYSIKLRGINDIYSLIKKNNPTTEATIETLNSLNEKLKQEKEYLGEINTEDQVSITAQLLIIDGLEKRIKSLSELKGSSGSILSINQKMALIEENRIRATGNQLKAYNDQLITLKNQKQVLEELTNKKDTLFDSQFFEMRRDRGDTENLVTPKTLMPEYKGGKADGQRISYMTDMNKQLQQADFWNKVLGDSYDATSIKMDVYSSAIQKIIEGYQNQNLTFEQFQNAISNDSALDNLINQYKELGLSQEEADRKSRMMLNVTQQIQSAFADVSSIEGFANAIREAAISAISSYIGEAVAANMKNAVTNSKNPYEALIVGTLVGAATKAMMQAAIPKFANGGEVPPGYPNDTYLAKLTSGEKIIPAGKSAGGTRVFGELHMTPKKLWWALKNYENTLSNT